MTDTEFRGYYPGSKVPLPTGPVDPGVAVVEKDAAGWDASPTKKTVKGKEVEFFTIGALAKALNKSVPTIRLWISNGYLPQAAFRLPSKNDIKGRRLYTRPQIEAIVSIATTHQILDGSRVDWSKHRTFADEVRRAWHDLPKP